MANVTVDWFSNAAANIVGGTAAGDGHSLDWIDDTIKVALLNAVPDQDTAVMWSDISATEVTGTNWSAGGVALTGKTVSVDAATNTTALDAADVNVSAVTVAGVEALAIYKDSGTATTSILLGYGVPDATVGASGGDLTIPWASGGVLTLQAV